MRPSRPGSSSTNAPKSVRRVTAVDALARHEALSGGLPRLGLELLEAKRNFVGLGIDFENAQRELLADGEHVFGLGDAAREMSLMWSRPSRPGSISTNAP
jgi:hypothetical protein